MTAGSEASETCRELGGGVAGRVRRVVTSGEPVLRRPLLSQDLKVPEATMRWVGVARWW